MVNAVRIFIVLLFVFLIVNARPVMLYAQGINLLADFEYFYTKLDTTDKETGIETDSEFSRFTQFYQVDIGAYLFPYLLFNFGGYFEQEDQEINEIESTGTAFDSENTEKTVRPYVELNLINPLYSGGLAYRRRDVERTGTFRSEENLIIDEYDVILNWRPVDFPLVNFNYRLIELEDDPLTRDQTRETVSLGSKYTYQDYSFHYLYNSLESFDNLEDSGNINRNHNLGVLYKHGFDVGEDRFDFTAGARFIYNTIEFLGTQAELATVDRPSSVPGSPFYIPDDISPTSNQSFEFIRVEEGHSLTDVNIGRNGGLNPVSAGLSFNSSIEVDTVYIGLSRDLDSFPNLATPSQIAAVADSFVWRFFASDDLVDPNWAELSIDEVTYNSIDNRFEIRLAETIESRHIKVTTTPLDLIAPGEIRYDSIAAFTTISGEEQKPEIFEQRYTFGAQWSPRTGTVFGYDAHFVNEEAKPEEDERTSITNEIYYRHKITEVFHTDGRLSRNERTRTTQQGDEDETDHLLSLSLRADYLDTLRQVLTYSGTHSEENGETDTTNFFILRTIADLYTGWTMNLDLGYGINSLRGGSEQTVTNVRVGTILEPNRNINISMDYFTSWIDDDLLGQRRRDYGTLQVLWALTANLNTFFRYSFRNEDAGGIGSTDLREFNINWTPFAGGTLQLSLGYNESLEFGDRELKTFTPNLTWEVARGVFLDVRYTTGTIDTPQESSDLDSIIAKLRFFY